MALVKSVSKKEFDSLDKKRINAVLCGVLSISTEGLEELMFRFFYIFEYFPKFGIEILSHGSDRLNASVEVSNIYVEAENESGVNQKFIFSACPRKSLEGVYDTRPKCNALLIYPKEKLKWLRGAEYSFISLEHRDKAVLALLLLE